MGIDEYSILKKKPKKNAFAATALLISIAIALLVMVGAVLVLSKVNDNDHLKASDDVVVSQNETEDSTCEGLVKEIVFNDNLKIIKEAAISYFTNERLPQNVGDTVKITLKTMQDKKLVLNVRDASAKTCDSEKSYVEVTKEDNEYVMKIFLSCSDLEDYIIVHLGCYDYCDSDVCEKEKEPEKVFEYEYKKTSSCVMSDWSNWGEWKTTREKISKFKKEETKTETTSKETIDKIAAIKNVSYSCDKYPGYTRVGTKCVKESTITDTKDATPNPDTYNCKKYPGYDVVGDKCVKDITVKEEKNAKENPTTYNCKKYPGYEVVGDKCVKTLEEKANVTYDCSEYGKGYKVSGTKCVKKDVHLVVATPEYGTRYVTKSYTCYKEECARILDWTCPTENSCGYYPVTTCNSVPKTCSYQEKEEYVSGYKCPSSEYTLSQNEYGTYICTTPVTISKKAKPLYDCDNYPGYELKDNKCVKDDTKKATPDPTTYNCKDYPGYDLVGDKCIRYVPGKDEQKAEKNPTTYNCKKYPGYEVEGSKCVKVTPSEDTINADEKVKYTCPVEYTLNDKECSRKIKANTKVTYYRYATRTCDGGETSIKWSTSKNDSILLGDGYKLTGNKRIVKEIIK